MLNSKLPKDVMQPKLFLGMMNCYHRPWHDTRAIAHARAITRANQEKGGLCRTDIACPKLSIADPEFISIDTTELILN